MRVGWSIGLTLLMSAGCASPTIYRIPAHLPWPDQWQSDHEDSIPINLPLSDEVVWWHRLMDRNRLQRQLNRPAAGESGAVIMIREGFAEERGRAGDDSRALGFVEVRINAWPLPIDGAAGRRDWKFEGESLEEVVSQCAVWMGAPISLEASLDPTTPIQFEANNLSAAEALGCILLRQDMFMVPAFLGATVLRSYEFGSEQAFLREVETQAREAKRISPAGPYKIVGLDAWCGLNEVGLKKLGLWRSEGKQVESPAERAKMNEAVSRYLRRLIEVRLQDRAMTPAYGIAKIGLEPGRETCRGADQSSGSVSPGGPS